MKKLNEFNIPFAGLKEGKHHFDFEIDRKFFETYQFDEFREAKFKIDLVFEKRATLLELNFSTSGYVNVPCDVTGDNFDLSVNGNLSFVVKFGQDYDDTNDEILVLPHEAYELNVAQYIYEMIVLSVPLKRVHPDVVEEEDLEEDSQSNTSNSIDPRWDQLKQFLDKK